MKCYDSAVHNGVGFLGFLSWFIYFSVGTFVVSKLQFLRKTSPFIVREGFATMFKLFQFTSVLLVLTSTTLESFSAEVAVLSLLSLLLLAMAVYVISKEFAIHRLARVLHRIGIMFLVVVNASVVVGIATSPNQMTPS